MLKEILKKTFIYKIHLQNKERKVIKKEEKTKQYMKKNGIKNIFFLQKKLSSLELPFFFDFGTLLGLYRDGGIINGDMDIDLGVLIDDENTVNDIEKKLSCFKKIRSFSAEKSGVAEQSFELNRYIRFDVHFYYKESNKRYCCLFYKLPEDNLEEGFYNTVKVKLDDFKIGTYSLNAEELSVPLPIEYFLIQKYGKDWRIPNSKWNYWEGPCSEKMDEKGHIDLFLK